MRPMTHPLNVHTGKKVYHRRIGWTLEDNSGARGSVNDTTNLFHDCNIPGIIIAKKKRQSGIQVLTHCNDPLRHYNEINDSSPQRTHWEKGISSQDRMDTGWQTCLLVL